MESSPQLPPLSGFELPRQTIQSVPSPVPGTISEAEAGPPASTALQRRPILFVSRFASSPSFLDVNGPWLKSKINARSERNLSLGNYIGI